MTTPGNYRHVRLDVADNGFVVEYTEIIKTDTGNPCSDTMHKDHQQIFTFKEGQKALDKLMELKGVKAPAAEADTETKAEEAKPAVEA